MAKTATQLVSPHQGQALDALLQIALAVGATLFVALCAHIKIPLMPLTTVPLTVQNFGVLLVGLLPDSRCGFAAILLDLRSGIAGLAWLNSKGPGGVAQLFGPTGGFLLAYP